MRASDSVEDLLARFETEVVGVVEAEPASCSLELLGSESFQRCLSSHRHEDGEVDAAMRQGQDGGAGASDLDAGGFVVSPDKPNIKRSLPGKLTEHRATSSNESAGEVKVLFEAILLVAHILPRTCTSAVRFWRRFKFDHDERLTAAAKPLVSSTARLP